MAYFSMWRLHGNRVSKTRFITLIVYNPYNAVKNPEQNIREEPREKKEKEKDRDWSG